MIATQTLLDTPSRDRFAALLDAHRGIVFKVANAYCRHDEDRRDLAQEIAAQLWRAWPRYDPARSFTTWMYRVALNVAISHLRADGQRRRHAVALDDHMPDDGMLDGGLHAIADDGLDHEREEQLRLLQAFIARQAPLDRALLLLYLEDRPQREIAEVLGLTESNVSTKIGRLKQRIRHEL